MTNWKERFQKYFKGKLYIGVGNNLSSMFNADEKVESFIEEEINKAKVKALEEVRIEILLKSPASHDSEICLNIIETSINQLHQQSIKG